MVELQVRMRSTQQNGFDLCVVCVGGGLGTEAVLGRVELQVKRVEGRARTCAAGQWLVLLLIADWRPGTEAVLGMVELQVGALVLSSHRPACFAGCWAGLGTKEALALVAGPQACAAPLLRPQAGPAKERGQQARWARRAGVRPPADPLRPAAPPPCAARRH